MVVMKLGITLAFGLLCLTTTFKLVDAQIKFISIGDYGEHLLPGQAMVADAMAVWAEVNQPSFVLTTGDNFYPNGIHSVNDPQIDVNWRYVYNHTSLVELPWYISVGNHDYGNDRGEEWNQVELSLYEPRWILPHLWHDFIVDVGAGSTAHIIVFDTEALRTGRNNYTEMLDWFSNVLATSTSRWKLVVGHRPVFSTGKYGPTTSQLYDVLLPVMLQYDVDVYMDGHDHNLQHIRQTDGGGPDFVVCGAGGTLWYAYVPANEVLLNTVYDMTVHYFAMIWGFIGVTIDDSSMIFDYYNTDNELVYTFTRTK